MSRSRVVLYRFLGNSVEKEKKKKKTTKRASPRGSLPANPAKPGFVPILDQLKTRLPRGLASEFRFQRFQLLRGDVNRWYTIIEYSRRPDPINRDTSRLILHSTLGYTLRAKEREGEDERKASFFLGVLVADDKFRPFFASVLLCAF